jgi:hypothetical protein
MVVVDDSFVTVMVVLLVHALGRSSSACSQWFSSRLASVSRTFECHMTDYHTIFVCGCTGIELADVEDAEGLRTPPGRNAPIPLGRLMAKENTGGS